MLPVIYEPDFWIYVGVGFLAQIVDGALGMAYGTLATGILLSTGMPPATVSASVHSVQFFTSGISGLSHAYFKNINRLLFLILTVCGAVGGVLGAVFLTKIDGDLIRPWIAGYLMFLGLYILWRRVRKDRIKQIRQGKRRQVFRAFFGFVGGFLDAIGGGWGPMVTSNLMARSEDPRKVIGSVNAAEFFVKTAIAVTFISTMAFSFGTVVLGLLVGGVLAAPFGAYILRFVKPEILMTLVGLLVVGLSGFVLLKLLLV